MTDRENVVKGLNDIGGFIAGRIGIEQARNFLRTIDDATALLKEQEAVVRCKDCRYGQHCTDGETTYQCFKWNSGEFGVLHEQDWFCADGERKGEQE